MDDVRGCNGADLCTHVPDQLWRKYLDTIRQGVAEGHDGSFLRVAAHNAILRCFRLQHQGADAVDFVAEIDDQREHELAEELAGA